MLDTSDENLSAEIKHFAATKWFSARLHDYQAAGFVVLSHCPTKYGVVCDITTFFMCMTRKKIWAATLFPDENTFPSSERPTIIPSLASSMFKAQKCWTLHFPSCNTV